MSSDIVSNLGILMLQMLALSLISADTAEKNGWKNVWILKVTEKLENNYWLAKTESFAGGWYGIVFFR